MSYLDVLLLQAKDQSSPRKALDTVIDCYDRTLALVDGIQRAAAKADPVLWESHGRQWVLSQCEVARRELEKLKQLAQV